MYRPTNSNVIRTSGSRDKAFTGAQTYEIAAIFLKIIEM